MRVATLAFSEEFGRALVLAESVARFHPDWPVTIVVLAERPPVSGIATAAEVITPSERDRAIVHRAIYDELVRGILSEQSREEYRRIMRVLADDGAEAIVLGCTEIELLVTQADSPVPVFPTTRIHVETAIDWALAD